MRWRSGCSWPGTRLDVTRRVKAGAPPACALRRLAGLLGGVWGAIVQPFGASGVVAGDRLRFVGALIGIYRYRENVRDETFSATTVVAASLPFRSAPSR
jgi:hypothetical protein